MTRDLLRLVHQAHGAVRVQDLALSRTERRALALLLDSQELVMAEPGVVAVHNASRDLVLARYYGGLLSCQAAIRFYDLPTDRTHDRLHLAVPKGSRSRPRGRVVLHEDRSVQRPAPFAFPVLDLDQALARYLRCHADPRTPLLALDAALNRGLLTAAQVASHLHGPGSARARERLGQASPRSRSPLETLARRQLIEAGLPVRDGVDIRGVGEIDLLVDDWVVVELDGYTYHADNEQFRIDRWRDRSLASMGFTVLRFTRQEVEAEEVVPAVRAVLRLSTQSRSRTKPGAVVN